MLTSLILLQDSEDFLSYLNTKFFAEEGNGAASYLKQVRSKLMSALDNSGSNIQPPSSNEDADDNGTCYTFSMLYFKC